MDQVGVVWMEDYGEIEEVREKIRSWKERAHGGEGRT
jgi:hypothetical protein